MLRKRAAFPRRIGRVFGLIMIEFIAKGVDDMELGKQIYELRKKANLSQEQLAEKVGVTEVSMSRYIRGERTPRGPILANIAAALHTTPEYLMNLEADEDSELVYYRTQRAIARNAKNWSPKQKADLVTALLLNE